ncbi:MAG: rhodanese-like domain-containing protein [Isosphaeraceae bacterium]|nr:rhodanese-like domain-containing protein [Isosphaeraceae bacterium]
MSIRVFVLISTIGWATSISAIEARADGKQTASPIPALVSHDELERRLGDPKLRLLDVRPAGEYAAGHIPGAVHVDAKAATALGAKPGGLTNVKAWEDWVEPFAIGPDTEVLVYGGKTVTDTARIWWLLRYVGVERAGMVDGNFQLWTDKKRPTSTEIAKPTPIRFAVRFDRSRLAEKGDVLSAIESGSTHVVDARSIGEYTGEKSMSKRGGHIPSACRLEWSDLVDAQGRFLAAEVLAERAKQAGIEAGKPAITHCQSGGRASVNAFVLERMGIPVRNYYLGWSEWGNAEASPIVEGKSPK